MKNSHYMLTRTYADGSITYYAGCGFWSIHKEDAYYFHTYVDAFLAEKRGTEENRRNGTSPRYTITKI